MKKRKTTRKEASEQSLNELLDRVEAEMKRLRAENKRLKKKQLVIKTASVPGTVKDPRPPRAQALGKGLAQLFGGPKRSA